MVGTEQPDDPYRRTATIVGVLFVVALVPFLIGGAVYGPATGPSDFLTDAYPDRAAVTLGVLLEFVAVLAIPLIGVFMFPVLKRVHESLALAYVGFRALEALLLIAIEAKLLSLIDLSDTHLNTADSDTTVLQAMGDSVLAEIDAVFGLYVLVFSVGALIFYGLLYRAALVPRWLSAWGFASAAWMLLGVVLIMFDAFSGTSEGLLEAIFVLPLPLNEIALALWLIVKGFSQSDRLRRDRPAVEYASIDV